MKTPSKQQILCEQHFLADSGLRVGSFDVDLWQTMLFALALLIGTVHIII